MSWRTIAYISNFGGKFKPFYPWLDALTLEAYVDYKQQKVKDSTHLGCWNTLLSKSIQVGKKRSRNSDSTHNESVKESINDSDSELSCASIKNFFESKKKSGMKKKPKVCTTDGLQKAYDSANDSSVSDDGSSSKLGLSKGNKKIGGFHPLSISFDEDLSKPLSKVSMPPSITTSAVSFVLKGNKGICYIIYICVYIVK